MGDARKTRPSLFVIGSKVAFPDRCPAPRRLASRAQPLRPTVAFKPASSFTARTLPIRSPSVLLERHRLDRLAGRWAARAITPWRNGLVNEPSAFSPDGSTLLLEHDRQPGQNTEIVARPLAGGPLRAIARNAEQPAFSPDGTRIAMISYRDRLSVETADGPAPVGELYVIRADGSEPRRLTGPTRPGVAAELESSGSRIAFLRVPGPGGLGFGSLVLQVNPDGTCARRVTGSTARRASALYGPAWQPALAAKPARSAAERRGGPRR